MVEPKKRPNLVKQKLVGTKEGLTQSDVAFFQNMIEINVLWFNYSVSIVKFHLQLLINSILKTTQAQI